MRLWRLVIQREPTRPIVRLWDGNMHYVATMEDGSPFVLRAYWFGPCHTYRLWPKAQWERMNW